MHSEEPNPRHEKNRRHVATFLCALAAAALLFLLQNVIGPARSHVVWASGLVYLLVLVGRTIFVELGLRRPLSPRETRLEKRVRKGLRRRLGIRLVEDTPKGPATRR